MDDPCFASGPPWRRVAQTRDSRARPACHNLQTNDGQITVSTRQQPLPDRYPHLSVILDDIGRTCRDEGIAVEQLRRIIFFEDKVNLETDDSCGGTDVFTWPIVPRPLELLTSA